MSRRDLATDAEITFNFNRWLKEAVDVGTWPPSDQGFDYRVDQALRKVAQSYPNVDEDLVRKAKSELEGQLDGTHEREAAAKWG